MEDFWKDLPWIIIVVWYVLQAMLISLPEPPVRFEFYPWFYHFTRMLINAIPQTKYKLPVPQAPIVQVPIVSASIIPVPIVPDSVAPAPTTEKEQPK